jgi:hypothetical protein
LIPQFPFSRFFRPLSSAFRALAGFIFGGNAHSNGESESISMTAPVHTEPVVVNADDEKSAPKSSQMRMAFYLPSKFKSLSELPRPKNNAVRLVEIPPTRYAVFTFSGFTEEDKVCRHDSDLSLQTKFKPFHFS